MKQRKFGIFDIILIVAIIAGIGLNVYAYAGDGSGNSMSPAGKPSVYDFGWFMGDVYKQGQPSGVTELTSFDEIKGKWKGMLFLDPDHKEYDIYACVLADVTISGSADSIKMTWKYYEYYEEDGNREALKDKDEYKGKFDVDLGLGAGGADDYFEIPFFWEKDGKQYAVGFNTVITGEEIYVGLVRP